MRSNEWLGSLKPGDEVIVSSRHYEDIRLVERITPTGRIVVNVGGMSTREFNADGWQRGGDSYGRSHIVEPTQERRDKIEQRTLVERLGRVKWGELPLETLRTIIAALNAR